MTDIYVAFSRKHPFTSCTKAVIVSQLKGGRGSGKKMLNTLKAKQANRQQRQQEQQRGRKKPTD